MLWFKYYMKYIWIILIEFDTLKSSPKQGIILYVIPIHWSYCDRWVLLIVTWFWPSRSKEFIFLKILYYYKFVHFNPNWRMARSFYHNVIVFVTNLRTKRHSHFYTHWRVNLYIQPTSKKDPLLHITCFFARQGR